VRLLSEIGAVHMKALLFWHLPLTTNICRLRIPFAKFLLLFAAALAPCVSFGQSVADSQAVEEARKVVVPIVCVVRDRNDKRIVRYRTVGTGFLVDVAGTFVTALHVIDSFSDQTQKTTCQGGITFSTGEAKARENGQWSALPKSEWERPPKDVKWFPVDFATCDRSVEFDVAVCKTMRDLTAEPVSHGIAIVSVERPPTGTSVFFIGFSLQATNPVVRTGDVKKFAVTNIYIDKPAWPGASGSPIFLPDGKQVVGMITKTGIENSAGSSFGVAGDKIAAILGEARAK
jgi:Trypsin-like peptidase domain